MPKKKAGRKPVKAKSPGDYVGSDWLLLTEITADPDVVQARVGLDQEVVADYGSSMLEQIDTKKGLQFPPCIVFDDGTTKWLSDGFHRYTAAQRTGGNVDRLDCEIRQGTKRDAMLYALGANATHGLRPSAADKHRAVSRMLQDEEWQQWADREIARKCGVVHSYVGKVRAELQEATGGAVEDPEQRRTYIDKHGTKTTMRTGGRRKPRKPAGDDDNDQQVEDDGDQQVGDVEVDEPSSVAEPDFNEEEDESTSLVAGAQALLDLSEEDVAALRSANEKLTAEKHALEAKVAELQAKGTGGGMSFSEFQTAIKKWENMVETQKTIIAQRDSEIASLRAGAAPSEPQPTEPQTLMQLFNRAVDVLALLDGMLSEGPDRWPKKVSARSRNQQINEVHSFLARLRGFRDVIELHSGESEEGQS
jgi:hypothetical protein